MQYCVIHLYRSSTFFFTTLPPALTTSMCVPLLSVGRNISLPLPCCCATVTPLLLYRVANQSVVAPKSTESPPAVGLMVRLSEVSDEIPVCIRCKLSRLTYNVSPLASTQQISIFEGAPIRQLHSSKGPLPPSIYPTPCNHRHFQP